VTRRVRVAIAVVAVLVVSVTTALVLTRDAEPAHPRARPQRTPAELTLIVVRTDRGPFGAVIGSTGGEATALVIPTKAQVTIPGQGDARLSDAFALPEDEAAITVANMLGTAIEHFAMIGPVTLAEIVDRAGGIEVAGETVDGAETLAMLGSAGEGRTSVFALVLDGLLVAGVDWQTSDVVRSDSPDSVVAALEDAAGASVSTLPVVEAATGIFLAEPETIRTTLVEAFGGPDRQVVDVIVLNGSGVPGVGQLVAERIVSDGFRVVLSENAATFDHEETLVVVGSPDDAGLGERVRDLLGTGSVNVSVASGIAPVTIVVGKDFGG
jgi:hypothetical protein